MSFQENVVTFAAETTTFNGMKTSNVCHINGKEKDFETGYHYYGARYYDSEKIKWLSVDPLSDKYPSMSPYAYCANNPVILVDPDGRDTLNIKYLENTKKWEISSLINAKGNDVFIVTKDNNTQKFEFSEEEYGERVNLLNLEISEKSTLGVYHVSGSSKAGFYVAPGGEASNEINSGKRIEDGKYPICKPEGNVKWHTPGVGGKVAQRGIRFHNAGVFPRQWTSGCFVLSSNYELKGNDIKFNPNRSLEPELALFLMTAIRKMWLYIVGS